MILLDSNLVIYLAKREFSRKLRTKIAEQKVFTCNIIVAEVLGFSKITQDDNDFFTQYFSSMGSIDLGATVTSAVVSIRKNNKIALADAFIAACATVNSLELWTNNIEDFQGIEGLRLYNPIA